MEWTFSQHALERAVDMAITADELRKVLDRPERTWAARDQECVFYRRGKVTLAVDFADKHVITVLWSITKSGQRWSRDDIGRCRDAKANPERKAGHT